MKYLFSILFIGMTLVSFAQNRNGQMERMTNFTPEQNAILQTKKMTLALDLNSSQQKQILEINKKRSIERKQKIEARRTMMSDGTKPTSNERFDMMNKMLDYQLVYQNQMKNILKSDQYTQWKTMHKGQMTKMHKKGKMMKGHGNYSRSNCNGKTNRNGRGSSNKNMNSNN
ncbi:MAG: hypothetical protein J7K34_05115 [Flavobacteriaceae bacterium]|nr:hypothetical protein [Flavobacteriaceae bacterium]